MLQSYPVKLTRDENGTVIAQFPDVPEAITAGADDTNALDWAQDAIVVALTGYIEERRDIPPPCTNLPFFSPLKYFQFKMETFICH